MKVMTQDELVALFRKFGITNLPTAQQLTRVCVDPLPPEIRIEADTLDKIERAGKRISGKAWENFVLFQFSGGREPGFHFNCTTWDDVYKDYRRHVAPQRQELTVAELASIRPLAYCSKAALICVHPVGEPNGGLRGPEIKYLRWLLFDHKPDEVVENLYRVVNVKQALKILNEAGFQKAPEHQLLDYGMERNWHLKPSYDD